MTTVLLSPPVAASSQISFPDRRLLQWDCGKLQRLASLLFERKRGGHRCLIFTQMTRMLDILEAFLNLHGHTYCRLDGSTKVRPLAVLCVLRVHVSDAVCVLMVDGGWSMIDGCRSTSGSASWTDSTGTTSCSCSSCPPAVVAWAST